MSYHILGVVAPELTAFLLDECGLSSDGTITFGGNTETTFQLASLVGQFDIAIKLGHLTNGVVECLLEPRLF